ncbi:MAG: YciI family protein [Actinomycetota bacterium]|nr:YciI family protein [Actinomycetota bacterium]
MAGYLVLIYEDEAGWENAGGDTVERTLAEHRAFVADHGRVLQGGHALEPVATATTLRRDASGDVVVTDGPFAETKEALGGYYLIDAADLDEALGIARRVPAPFGGVEVRPIRTFA